MKRVEKILIAQGNNITSLISYKEHILKYYIIYSFHIIFLLLVFKLFSYIGFSFFDMINP